MSNPLSTPSRPSRVLVVDDHQQLRELLTNALVTRLAAQVEQAADIPQALAALSAGVFDVVMADVNLPGTSSLDALPSLRAAAPSARIVLMSAAVPPDLAEKALRAGADQFIAKFAGLNSLCAAVDPTWLPATRTTDGPQPPAPPARSS